MFIREFIRALWRHWIALASGSVSVLLSGVQYAFQWNGSHKLDVLPPWLLLIVGAGLILFATYKAWGDEYVARAEMQERIYDGRPIILLNVIKQPSWDPGKAMHEGIFALHNCGGRAARFIRPESQKSRLDSHGLAFAEIPSLMPEETKSLAYEIDQHGDHQGMLFQFLSDNPPEAALVWWDIKINFRDTDESLCSELVRLCFDIRSKHLYSTAVPYTERGFERKSLIHPTVD